MSSELNHPNNNHQSFSTIDSESRQAKAKAKAKAAATANNLWVAMQQATAKVTFPLLGFRVALSTRRVRYSVEVSGLRNQRDDCCESDSTHDNFSIIHTRAVSDSSIQKVWNMSMDLKVRYRTVNNATSDLNCSTASAICTQYSLYSKTMIVHDSQPYIPIDR